MGVPRLYSPTSLVSRIELDKLEFVDTFTPLSLVSLDSSPSRVEPNIAFPLRGESVTAGDGRGDSNHPDKFKFVTM